jgi:hypothetical protein
LHFLLSSAATTGTRNTEAHSQHHTAAAHPTTMSDREFGGNDDLSLPKGRHFQTSAAS